MQARAPRTQPDAERIEGEGQSASVVLIHGPVLLRRAAAFPALLTNDLVFGLRIRIPSQVRLGSQAALSDREYLHSDTHRRPEWNGPSPLLHRSMCGFDASNSPALAHLPWRQSLHRSALYDMHRDHPHCPPPAPRCTTPTRRAQPLRSDYPPASCACAYDFSVKTRPRAPQLRQWSFLTPAPPSLPSHPPPSSTVLTARRPQHLRQQLPTTHGTCVASPRVVPSSAPSPPSAENLPLACTSNTTRTPCASPTHALRPSAPQSAQGQVLSRSAAMARTTTIHSVRSTLPITHTTFVPSPRALTIHRADPPPPLDSPACTHPSSLQKHMRVQRVPRTLPTAHAARCTHRI
ncbi:hypothetical protein K438DRAFT_1968507 [Mycena galopus ATCC 62051]|nr:hypothetical protein K438DRAFT_1968507 [Mycena galopus ATCC 62051]